MLHKKILSPYLLKPEQPFIFVQKINKTEIVRIAEIIKYTNARVISGDLFVDRQIEKAFSSDLMSDVLTLEDENFLLITGLSNIQLLRTAEMANVKAILLARNKTASHEMVELAAENKIVLLETPFSMFKASGILYSQGLKPVY